MTPKINMFKLIVISTCFVTTLFLAYGLYTLSIFMQKMHCVKAGTAFYWVFLVCNECFSGISPSYAHLDFEETLNGSDIIRGGCANGRKHNWSRWTFQGSKRTVRRTTPEFGESPRFPTTYSKKKAVGLQLVVGTQAAHGSCIRLEPFSGKSFVLSANISFHTIHQPSSQDFKFSLESHSFVYGNQFLLMICGLGVGKHRFTIKQ